MKSVHTSIFAFFLMLAGCSGFQLLQLPELSEPQQETFAKEVSAIKETLQKMCNTAVESQLRADELYKGKKLSVSATFSELGNNRAHHYELTFVRKWQDYKDIVIFAETKDKGEKIKQAALTLSKGKDYTVSGTVLRVSAPLNCTIHLADVEFSEQK